VLGGESNRPRVVLDAVETKRASVGNKDAEDSLTDGKAPNGPASLLANSRRDEIIKRTGLAQDPEGTIGCVSYLTGEIDDLLQNRGE
jgi:hypothetical protein